MRSYRPVTSKEAKDTLCADIDGYDDPIQPERFYVACAYSSPGNGVEEETVVSGPLLSLRAARMEASARNIREDQPWD